MCDFSTPSKCVNSPERFCYICGQVTLRSQRVTMTPMIHKAYKLYFGYEIRDQDKSWVPHKCCVTCGSYLRSWLKKKIKKMRFAIPMIWSEPSNHIDDCYFCIVGRIQCHKKRKDHVYPNIPSAKRPVPHGYGRPVPVPPDWHKEKKESAIETIEMTTVFDAMKEEPAQTELTSVEMKLETEEHSFSHLQLDDEDLSSSVDGTTEQFPQTEASRLSTKTEEDHETSASSFFQAANLENGDCFAREGTASYERTDALHAGVLQGTELSAAAITELNNGHTSSHENIHKTPVKRTYIPDFETEESRQLSTSELQRLLLIEQLKLTRLQTAFYEKRMKHYHNEDII